MSVKGAGEALHVLLLVNQGEVKAANRAAKVLIKQQKPVSLWHILIK